MAKDSGEIRVASYGTIYAGPVGTAMPANPTAAPNSAFVDLGYATEDGVTFTVTPTVEDINAWQSQDPVRRIVTSRVNTIAFSLEQLNQENFVVAFGGGSWTQPSAGIYRYTPPASADALAEIALLVRTQDGNEHDQYEVYRCSITDAVETQMVRSGAQMLPMTLTGMAPDGGGSSWGFVSDDALAYGLLS